MSYDTGLSLEERVTSLFQPDTLLSAQYFDTFRRKSHLEPEKKLMLAILEDAIACFQKYIFARDSKGKVLFQDAEDWVCDENGDWLFSFTNICETLGLNPSYVREGLLQWKEAKVREHSTAKVYQFASRRKTRKSNVGPSRKGNQRMLKVAGRR